MKMTLITLTCPGDCQYTESYNMPTRRLQAHKEELTSGETLEDAVLAILYAGYDECPKCETQYEVEIGTSVESDGGCSVVTGP